MSGFQTAMVRGFEVAELEERLHDEVLCEHEHEATICLIVARYRFRKTCPERAMSKPVCRTVADVVASLSADSKLCGGCRRPVSVCWVVTDL